MKNWLMLAAVLLASCGNNQTTETNADTTANNVQENAVETSCYKMAQNGDSASLQLQTSGTVVQGALTYNLKEKDSNKGNLEGILRDSLIIANYTFQAEGTSSIRQVVFKMQGDTLLEGYGDIDASGDTTKFKNIDQLQYNTNRPFIKTNCNP